MQRIGEEFRKNRNLQWSNQTNQNSNKKSEKIRNNIIFLTSNAIDFAAIHGEDGKFIDINHRFYHKYHELTIIRFNVLRVPDEENTFQKKIFSDETQFFKEICKKHLNLEDQVINFFQTQGPIFPTINHYISEKTIREEGQISDELKIKFVEKNINSESVIHSTYLPYANIIYALLLGKKWNIPTVITPFLHELNDRYELEIILKVLDRFDLIFACTNHEKKILTNNHISENKIIVNPMGIDYNKFHTIKNQKNKSQNENKNPIVLFCGYKNYEKGAISLLKAIPLIMNEKKDVDFIFIGPSTKAFNYTLNEIRINNPQANIINITPDNLSGIFDPQKIKYFQQANIYCMPSRSEAYGIAYLEAWACKKPVIGADIPAIREVIDHNHNGLLVEFDKPNEIKDAIIYLLSNENIAINMGINGYERIIKNNLWSSIGMKTLEGYQKIINQSEKKTGN